LTPLPGKTGPEAGKTVVLLGALCLFLSTLEYLVPKPLPYLRIGLANLPLMLALDLLSPRYFSLLALIKIAGAGLVGGTIFSYVFIFSVLGSAASALVMYGLRTARFGKPDNPQGSPALRRSPKHRWRFSLAGIGVAGAMCSGGVQLFLARFLVFGEAARYLIPPFLAVSLITGCALGLFCEHFCRRSLWYRSLLAPESLEPRFVQPVESGQSAAGGPPPLPRTLNRRSRRRELWRYQWDRRFAGPELIVAGFIALLLFLLNPSTIGRFLQFLFFWLCAWASGRKNNPFITLSVVLGVILVNLLVPYGRVLAELGPLHITAGSLEGGLRKGFTLEGLIMLSSAVIRGKTSGSLPTWLKGKSRPAMLGHLAVFGRFLGESLAIFSVLQESRGRVRPGHLIEDVDGLLFELDRTPVPVEREATDQTTRRTVGLAALGRLWLVLGLLITAALTAMPL
jgi:heptaprenyl diphosphate synthase